MAGDTNEEGAAEKGNKKGGEKETSGWKSAGTAGAGAATGAAAAAAIKYSDDMIRFVAGEDEDGDEAGTPEQDPNIPESDLAPEEGVSTSASAISQNQSSAQSTPETQVMAEANGPGDEIRDSQEDSGRDEDEEVIDSADVFMMDTDANAVLDTVSLNEDPDDIIDSTFSTEPGEETAITGEVSKTEMDNENEFIGPPAYDLADDMPQHQSDDTDQSDGEEWDAYNPENII